VFGLRAINQLQVGDSEQNNRDTLHLSRHDSGKLRALASSNSVHLMTLLFAWNLKFYGRLPTHPRYHGATNLREKSQQEEKHENKRSNFRKLFGCRRVDGVASDGYAGQEIVGLGVKTSGSTNDTGGAP
jgi:hypothetical protein